MILKNCRLVPELCDGFQEEYADIRIEGDTIVEILPAGGRYAGEEVIDCKRMTVLPGLHNLHTHLWFFTIDNGLLARENNEYDMTVRSVHYMNTLLAYGYTSLRDVGCPYNLSIKLRNNINAGQVIGPRIKACGYILTPHQYCPTNLHCHSDKYDMAINDPVSAREFARKQLVDGADFLKILGSSVTGLDRDDSSLLYPDELDALEEVARREKTYLAVHANTKESILTAINRHHYTIEHCNGLDQDCIDAFVKNDYKSNMITTTQITCSLAGEEAVKFLNGHHRDAADAGVMIGWGTDATEDMFLLEPGAEFRLRKDVLGFNSIDVLKQATINSAIINHEGDSLGSIKIGKKADFAVFDGEPDKDFRIFNHPCAFVIKAGEVVAERGKIKWV